MAKAASTRQLLGWYSSDHAKRALGGLCQQVNELGSETTLLGSSGAPLLILRDADQVSEDPTDVCLSIDEVRADWPAITTAAALFDTRFRIQGKRVERAVLLKHPDAQHPAERYRRSLSPDANMLAERIEALAKEIRKLTVRVGRSAPSFDEFQKIVDKISSSADLIDRRFREIWRVHQGYPALSAAVQ